MRSRRSVLVSVIVAMIASAMLLAPAASADSHPVECDKDYVKVSGKTIRVLPTGVDDTENLQCALDLAGTMSWAKIKLMAAKYYTGFLTGEDLFVVIRGAGKHKTTIYTLPEGIDCLAVAEELDFNMHLMRFAASKVVLNGFTIAIGGDAPCAEPWAGFVDEEGFGFEEWSIGAIFVAPRLEFGEPCPGVTNHRLRVYNVAVESEFADFEEPILVFKNFSTGIVVDTNVPSEDCLETRMRGEVTVRGCDFSGNGASIVAVDTQDSKITIGGKKAWQANTFDGVGTGVFVANPNGGKVLVKHNEIHEAHFWGVLAEAGFPSAGEIGKVTVSKNDILGTMSADGVGILDFGLEFYDEPLLDAAVWYNDIEMVDSEYNGIIAIGTDGKIKGNRISGASFSGIMLDGVFDDEEGVVLAETTGWYVAKNNLKGLEAFAADYWLWPPTRENTVMCMHPADEAVDLGVDNTIVGCTLIDPPPEPEDTLQATPQDVLREKPLPRQLAAFLER